MLTDHTYSSSTSNHQGNVRRAIPRTARTFYVPVSNEGYYGYPSVSGDHRHNLKLWREGIQRTAKDAKAAREPKKSRLALEAVAIIEKAKEYAAFFGVKWNPPALPWSEEQIAVFNTYQNERERKWRESRETRQHKARERSRVRTLDRYEAWLRGEKVNTWEFDYSHPAALRVKGDEVETSKGARFPVSHARRGLALVDSVVKSGQPWQANGHTCKLGHYQIDSIDADGAVRAGCHVVSLEAINRVRAEIGGTSNDQAQ